MKKIFVFVAFAVLGTVSAQAQSYYQDSKNSEMLRHADRHETCRREMVLPQVNGYNVYKADLHTHTIFSDGQVLPSLRVQEAWLDGLDIMAVTEHIEHRPTEATFVEYLVKYVDEKYDGAVNHKIGSKGMTEEGLMVDLNHCVKLSQKEAEKYDREIDYLYGKLLLEKKDPVLKELLLHEEGKYSRLFDTLKDNPTENAQKRIPEVEEKLALMREALACL